MIGDWRDRDVQDLAALDYAETALSEAWAALRAIAKGHPDPVQVAMDLLDAHGFERVKRADTER